MILGNLWWPSLGSRTWPPSPRGYSCSLACLCTAWFRMSSPLGSNCHTTRTFPLRPFPCFDGYFSFTIRSEEHTSELQSLRHLVCRLLLEKKKPAHRRPAYRALVRD